MNNNYKEGFAAEVMVLSLFTKDRMYKVHKSLFTAQQVIAIAKKHAPLDWKAASPYIQGDIGGNIDVNDVWDKALHVDVLINYKGWVIAMDLTTNGSVVERKVSKLAAVKTALTELEVDRALVLHCTRRPTHKEFEAAIRQCIATEEFVTTVKV